MWTTRDPQNSHSDILCIATFVQLCCMVIIHHIFICRFNAALGYSQGIMMWPSATSFSTIHTLFSLLLRIDVDYIRHGKMFSPSSPSPNTLFVWRNREGYWLHQQVCLALLMLPSVCQIEQLCSKTQALYKRCTWLPEELQIENPVRDDNLLGFEVLSPAN